MDRNIISLYEVLRKKLLAVSETSRARAAIQAGLWELFVPAYRVPTDHERYASSIVENGQ
jgi:hypothetical protein